MCFITVNQNTHNIWCLAGAFYSRAFYVLQWTVKSFHPLLRWSKAAAEHLREHTTEVPGFWACLGWTGHNGPDSSRTWTVYNDPSVPHHDNGRSWVASIRSRAHCVAVGYIFEDKTEENPWGSVDSIMDYYKDPWWRAWAILWGREISTKISQVGCPRVSGVPAN